MKKIACVATLSVLVLTLTACVNVGSQSDAPAGVYYVLNDTTPAPAVATPAPANAPTLLVLAPLSGSFYDTDQLAFSRNAHTRGQYQFARWTERPGQRIADLMRTRLERQGIWHVVASGSHVRGDLLLDTELVEFYHDASQSPGQLRLALRVKLVNPKQRSLLGQRLFEQQVALTTYDAAGAAQAANQAVSQMLDELTVWLASFK